MWEQSLLAIQVDAVLQSNRAIVLREQALLPQ